MTAPVSTLPESPELLAASQVTAAQLLTSRDLGTGVRWAWPTLDDLVGPMLPGDLVVVGALMGNGKTSLLLSQMDALAAAETPTLYLPLEIDPALCRLRWAAWKLNLDVRRVVRQEWDQLPRGAKAAIHDTLTEQESVPWMHFAPPKRLSLSGLKQWCVWAQAEYGARVVLVDHLHRLESGGSAVDRRVTVTDMVRLLKDLARDLGLVVLCAAQLNRSADPIDGYLAPTLARLKESAAIGEEADVVLMLSRRLKAHLPDHWQADLRTGTLTELDLAEPKTMLVTCRKHRLDDAALNMRVSLRVENGRVREDSQPTLTDPHP